MANIPTSTNISHHLADRAGTPLISSSNNSQSQSQSPSQAQAQALSLLTTAAMTAYEHASRLGLGLPQRILIETSSLGPVILHSYLNPQSSSHQPAQTPINGRRILEQAREDLRPLSGTTESSSVAGNSGADAQLVNGVDHGKDTEETEAERDEKEGNGRQVPPMLVGTVVAATAPEVGEARRTAARLERVGREFQREWVRAQETQDEPASGSGEDG